MRVIDLHYLGNEHVIACFLLETTEGYVLVESGPHNTYDALRRALAEGGVRPADIKHVLLTHIHLDHAGSAWALANEGATVHVHPFGYPHMKDPSKLLSSARRVYGVDFDRLCGLLCPIPAERLRVVNDKATVQIGDLSFVAHHTPGHANHHICWQWADVLFTGDVAGIRIDAGPVVPPCPPPDISVEHWMQSCQLVSTLSPTTLYLTHYGPVSDVDAHLQALKSRLTAYAEQVKKYMDANKSQEEMAALFEAHVTAEYQREGLTNEDIARYHTAIHPALTVAGLVRYWQKKASRNT